MEKFVTLLLVPFSFVQKFSLSLSLSHTHTRFLALALAHTHTFSHSRSRSRLCTHTHVFSLSLHVFSLLLWFGADMFCLVQQKETFLKGVQYLQVCVCVNMNLTRKSKLVL
jgi:hypothetical protein